MAGYLSVSGVTLKTPKKFQVSIQDIDGESGRNANGDMTRDRITQKQKLEIEWGPLSNWEISSILNAVDSAFFQATYPNPKLGSMDTKTFYVGDRSSPSLSWNKKTGLPEWEGLSMNFVEK